MKKTKRNIKIYGLQAELTYCLQKQVENHKSPHWAIREQEIVAELKVLKKVKKK